MIIWKKRLNNYGLSNLIIVFLICIALVSVVAEIVSIGMFLPMLELLNQHGAEGLAGSDSSIVKFVYDFV